jgi:hypothetical protein
MSFKLIDKIIESEDVVKGTDKYVLIVMAKHANDDGTDCYPSIKTLARECGVTRDTIYEHLGSLIAQGLITDTGEHKIWPRGHYTVIYRVNVERFDSAEEIDSVDSSEKPCRKRRQAVSNPRTQLCPIPSLRSGNSVQPLATQSNERVNERESEESSAATPPQAKRNFSIFKDRDVYQKLKALLGSKDRVVYCWVWNQAHKSGRFLYQSESDMLDKLSKADRSNPKGTFAQLENHENLFPEQSSCKKCWEYTWTRQNNIRNFDELEEFNKDFRDNPEPEPDSEPLEEAPLTPAVPPKFNRGYLPEGSLKMYEEQ